MADTGAVRTVRDQRPRVRWLVILIAVCCLLLTVGYFILVQTVPGHTFDADGYFGRAVGPRETTLHKAVIDANSNLTLALALAAITVIGVARRTVVVGLIAAFAVGCAVVGAQLFKNALPWERLIPNDSNYDALLQQNSYPSTTATIGASLALALILIAPVGWRKWVAVGAGLMIATYATGVLILGWHRPSDALGAMAWSTAALGLAAVACVKLKGVCVKAESSPRRAFVTCFVLAALMFGGLWVSAASTQDDFPGGDGAYLVAVAVMVVLAFVAAGVFGWLLRSIDWRSVVQSPTD